MPEGTGTEAEWHPGHHGDRPRGLLASPPALFQPAPQPEPSLQQEAQILLPWLPILRGQSPCRSSVAPAHPAPCPTSLLTQAPASPALPLFSDSPSVSCPRDLYSTVPSVWNMSLRPTMQISVADRGQHKRHTLKCPSHLEQNPNYRSWQPVLLQSVTYLCWFLTSVSFPLTKIVSFIRTGTLSDTESPSAATAQALQTLLK